MYIVYRYLRVLSTKKIIKKKKNQCFASFGRFYFLGLDSSLFFPPSDGSEENRGGGGRGGSVWTVIAVSVDRPWT